MRKYGKLIDDPKFLYQKSDKWIRGLNILVSATQIRPDEVAEMTDSQLIEDGKIQCPRDGQAYYGTTNGSRITGLYPFNKSDGTKQLVSTSGTGLYKYTSATAWTLLTGQTYTTTLNTNGIMTHDRLYLCNGTEGLSYYGGTSITTFTAVGTANTPTVTPTGGTGAYTYSYKITAVTAVGESIASATGTSTGLQQTLDSTHYMTVAWSATTSAIGYNIYGRKDGQWFFLAYNDGNANVSYVDKAQDTPISYLSAGYHTGDQTAGPKGTLIEVYHDSIFIAGDTASPSTLYLSGGFDAINNFTSDTGGGTLTVGQNDGQKITGLKVFKNALIVFKEDSIYQFSFTSSGAPSLQLINGAVGCIAPRSIVVVENDVYFLSRRGVFTIGNEPGFAFDVLRTNELSSRVRGDIKGIDAAYIQNAAAVYTSDSNKNLVIFSYTPSGSTTNSKALVYDRERLGWYRWTNIQANCWAKWVDSSSATHYLYGDDASGYVKEILTGTNDFSSAIHGYFSLRAESFGTKGNESNISTYKILKDISIVLRKPSGSVSLSLITDGVTTAYSNNIGTVSPTINFAHYVFNRFLFKTSYGTGVSSADNLALRTVKNVNVEAKTFQLVFDNNSSASFVLLEVKISAKPRADRYRVSGDIVSG